MVAPVVALAADDVRETAAEAVRVSGRRRPMAAREWIEAAAARVAASDPAARLGRAAGDLDELTARLAAWRGTDDVADHLEVIARLERIEATVRGWRGLAAALEATRPAIEAAERVLRAAGR